MAPSLAFSSRPGVSLGPRSSFRSPLMRNTLGGYTSHPVFVSAMPHPRSLSRWRLCCSGEDEVQIAEFVPEVALA